MTGQRLDESSVPEVYLAPVGVDAPYCELCGRTAEPDKPRPQLQGRPAGQLRRRPKLLFAAMSDD